MGKGLHVAKTYKVEYDSFSTFNWKIEEFHALLTALGVYYTGEPYDEDFEVLREEFECGIRKLKNFDSLEQYVKEGINDALEELECDIEKIIELLETYLEHSEKDDYYLHFSFF